MAAGVLNLVKFLILLHRVADDYVTLFDVYVCAINPDDHLADVIARASEAGPMRARRRSSWPPVLSSTRRILA